MTRMVSMAMGGLQGWLHPRDMHPPCSAAGRRMVLAFRVRLQAVMRAGGVHERPRTYGRQGRVDAGKALHAEGGARRRRGYGIARRPRRPGVRDIEASMD